jgi:hypothetical protein
MECCKGRAWQRVCARRDGEMARWREEGRGRGEHYEGAGRLMELVLR